MDGRVDPKRIAAEAKRLADPDVFCLQEIARNFPEMEGSTGEDQVEELKRELVATFADEPRKYADAKGPFVRSVLRRAREPVD